MHATIDVRLTISIDDDKTVLLATLAEFKELRKLWNLDFEPFNRTLFIY